MWEGGTPASAIGAEFGVTKNVVIGLAYRRGWPRDPRYSESQIIGWSRRRAPITTFDSRIAALYARLDEVLLETGAL